MRVHKSNNSSSKIKVSVVFLDWSCREKFFGLDWLSRQDVPRDEYEIIWVELYDRVVPEAMGKADVVISCEQKGRYHKHKGYNAGLLAAKGEVITVCDSDAVFPRDFISSINNKFGLDDEKAPKRSLVLMHYEKRTQATYPDDMASRKQLDDYTWHPLWENVGACVSVRRDDAIRYGGFDEHSYYRGYICGPYDLAWRHVNAGIPEQWHDPSVVLWHFDHPNEDYANIYKRIKLETFCELGFIHPHVREHALKAVEAFSAGRILPFKENPEVHKLRMAKRIIGSDYEKAYAMEISGNGFSRGLILLMKWFHFENFMLRFFRRVSPRSVSIYSKFADDMAMKKYRTWRHRTLGAAGVMYKEPDSDLNVIKADDNKKVDDNKKKDKKMNILFVSDDDLTKSVVYDIHVMAEGLSVQGHNVYMVDCKYDKANWFRPIKQDMARVYPDAKVHMFRYSMKVFPIFTEGFIMFVCKFLYAFLSCYKLVRKVVKKHDIDIIVSYSVVNSGLSAARIAKKYNIPVVFRNIDMLYRLNGDDMIRNIVAFFERMVYPRMNKIFALTPKYAEYVTEMGADPASIDILPFPVAIPEAGANENVDGNNFPGPCQKWFDEKRPLIVFVGHLYNFGGLDEFIHEFPLVLKEVPNASLLLVGDGPMRERLEGIVRDLKLEDNVFITGLQPFETMPQYISKASVCINAYPVDGDMKDLFAAKVIQYLACGKAAVSSALPGMTTMIEGESCGVVYVDDAAAMAREMISLLKSPERREKLGQAGLAYVRKIHSREQVVRKLGEELESCIGQKPKKRTGHGFFGQLLKSLRTKSYCNELYNSASMGHVYSRNGQRFNRLRAGAVINDVMLFMDKTGDPKGTGSCVIRKVSDDSILGVLGSLDVSRLPATPADPKWVQFNSTAVTIPEKGDYRIVFEWDAEGGDEANHPRVRYNAADSIGGVYTQYSSDNGWEDRHDADTSIKIRIT